MKWRTSGAVVCPSCGSLVGAREPRCPRCGRSSPGFWGFAPLLGWLGRGLAFEQILIGGCAALYLATLVADPSGIGMRGVFSLLAPSQWSLLLFGASGAVPVFGLHRWWTVLSAGWLHGSLLHVLFNVMWLRQLGPAIAQLYGGARMVIVYTVASVTGFVASSAAGAFLADLPRFLRGAGLTVGASAGIFGLLAALVHYGRRGGASAVGQQAWTWAVVLFLLGFVMGGVDNWAHLGGYAGGYVAARWLDPLRPERADHLLVAVLALLLSAAAVVVSVVTGGSLGG